MRTKQRLQWLSLLAITVLLSSCSFLNPASRLYGTWKLDVDATIDRAAGGNELQKSAMRAMWALVGGDVTMELRADGTCHVQGNSALGGGDRDGTWKLLSADGNTLRVEIASGQTADEHALRMIDDNTFEVDLNAGGQVITSTFRRQP